MSISVPFYRPDLSTHEIQEVVDTLQSGWLTTGPRVRRFEQEFAAAVGAKYAIALNSCTAALHLSVEALGLRRGQGVLVPTMTFAATAEVVRYLGGIPILVDCDPRTAHLDLADAERKLAALRTGSSIARIPAGLQVVGMIPVHVGGLMMDVRALQDFAARHELWVVDDAAHAFPAAFRSGPDAAWQRCGDNTAAVSCFSFYANKTITTGEGGMAVTNDPELAERIALMSLHGLSKDAWQRYSNGASWDYRILAPGYKYNLTDLAAAIGIHQLARAEHMRAVRQAIAEEYRRVFAELEEFVELPATDPNRMHSWHLFPLALRLERLRVDRDRFMESLAEVGVRCSVHWRPLHLHPYYQDAFAWTPDDLPAASQLWRRLVSLPLFSAMRRDEIDGVIAAVKSVVLASRRRSTSRLVAAAARHPATPNYGLAGRER